MYERVDVSSFSEETGYSVSIAKVIDDLFP
jgi:hypothetical protein